MKLSKCADGYRALLELGKEPCSFQTAHAMMKLKRKLQEEAEYLAEQEMKLAQKYAVLDDQGKIRWTGEGRFQLRPGQAEAYRAEVAELMNIDVSITPEEAAAPPERITMEQLEALEGMLIFKEV